MENKTGYRDLDLKRMHFCFVGNMLGHHEKYVTTQGQIVADLFAREGYQVTRVSSKINRVARLFDTVQRLIRGFRTFDMVILDAYSGMNVITADITGWLCNRLKIPLVMVLRGGNFPKFIEKYPRWTKRVLNRADHLVAPSSYLAEKIGVWGYEIEVIPNVIDLENYAYRERSKIPPRLIWMRSFNHLYNPEMAIKVLARLKESEPQATLVMAGADKGLEDEIKKMTEEMGLSDSVRFAGFLDLKKKIREFSEADIYLNTNRIDNMPVSVVEARALGLPVIATDVGGLPYLIKHGENGLLVPSDDVDSMVENVKLLLNDPELTRKISQNGREIAERSAWTSVRKELEAMIKRVLGKKSTENKVSLLEKQTT
ncbi:MAG: glycosyltransferase family 4 protein [Pyrinomonadaceae bacterium]